MFLAALAFLCRLWGRRLSLFCLVDDVDWVGCRGRDRELRGPPASLVCVAATLVPVGISAGVGRLSSSRCHRRPLRPGRIRSHPLRPFSCGRRGSSRPAPPRCRWRSTGSRCANAGGWIPPFVVAPIRSMKRPAFESPLLRATSFWLASSLARVVDLDRVAAAFADVVFARFRVAADLVFVGVEERGRALRGGSPPHPTCRPCCRRPGCRLSSMRMPLTVDSPITFFSIRLDPAGPGATLVRIPNSAPSMKFPVDFSAAEAALRSRCRLPSRITFLRTLHREGVVRADQEDADARRGDVVPQSGRSPMMLPIRFEALRRFRREDPVPAAGDVVGARPPFAADRHFVGFADEDVVGPVGDDASRRRRSGRRSCPESSSARWPVSRSGELSPIRLMPVSGRAGDHVAAAVTGRARERRPFDRVADLVASRFESGGRSVISMFLPFAAGRDAIGFDAEVVAEHVRVARALRCRGPRPRC